MALVVTPGAANADAYISLDAYKTYCTAMGWSYPSGTGADTLIEQGIRRATAWIDGTYRSRFLGNAADAEQALEWPRENVWRRGEELSSETIPPQVEKATAEAARREIAKPGSLSPDLKRGGRIKEVGAGSAKVVFADGAPAGTMFKAIDGLLGDLLAPASASRDTIRV